MTRPKDVNWSPQEWEGFWDLIDRWSDFRSGYGGSTRQLTSQSLRSILSRLEKDIRFASSTWPDPDPQFAGDIATIRHLRKRL